ncbi:hypothetical protein M501DRAFT_936145 [Patellaria atrata CBS 101060]|uniref:Arrestin C-terminal-like domain-containing protein n=1 Tax=Patellaria atrata CBS 101060 TaxID=1346257 RepID=A0A9P4VQS7_9PEZI|nr:hypothetical protein M501DRAFT_936145 [Patellaria atrata CBS 101060]
MTEVRTIPSARGRLTYVPEHLHEYPERPSALFLGRSRRPQRILIARVPPEATPGKKKKSKEKKYKKSKGCDSESLPVRKVAHPAENAKRFIRSFIASSAGSQQKVSSLPLSRAPTTDTQGSSLSVGSGERGTMPVDVMRPHSRSIVGGPISGMVSRPELMEDVRRASGAAIVRNSSPIKSMGLQGSEKPLASGNGVSVFVNLAEPLLYLQGFEPTDTVSRSTAMLRGSLMLRVSKNAKIRGITLKFKGRATTKWPEGIPPRKTEFDETDNIMSHTWPFFNAQFPNAEHGTGADSVQLSNGPSPSSSNLYIPKTGITIGASPMSSSMNLSSKEAKKLSLQVNQSRSFGKGESGSVAQKGYRTFLAGEYTYNFELPLDSHLPETIDVDLGSVKYELEATVERAGAFRANLVGTKEVVLIRAPSEGSLEQVEPIAISRNWEDQLHYDIVISGKSFPLGAQVPIAFKLTPLAKVQCHRIKVFVTENIEYFCCQKRVHRMEPTRKVLLFEKRADGPPQSTFPGSTMRITAGGGVPYDQRAAAARGEHVPPTDPTNLLGLLNSDSNVGPTEMEFNVQLPSCMNMREKEKAHKLHFDTTYQNIQVHHWIKIVMRLSKPDQNDPTKRRHFEISIDSPFHILSCQATQANTSLPAYSSPHPVTDEARLPECGCPGAAIRRTTPTQFVPTLNSLNSARENGTDPPERIQSPGLARPPQAHIGGPIDPTLARPIHLVRSPSFNPPAFEEDEPPPPLITPPPEYDSIASPTSGLADYFARLSDAGYDTDSDDGSSRRPARIDIPLTPGSRINRSMDEPRLWLPVGHPDR